MENIPWPQVEGAQRLVWLRGWLQGRGAPSPMQPWLPKPPASVSPCGNAIPNPSWCFRASAGTQSHPRAAQPREKPTFTHCPTAPQGR